MPYRWCPTGSLLATGCLLLAFAGCSGEESPRSVLRVISINDNQPLQSDVVSQAGGGGNTIFEDEVPVSVRNDPADPALNVSRGGPFGYVMLDRYTIHFESDEEIPEVNGSLGWTVHTGETVSGSIVVVPATMKTQPPLVSLIGGGEITTTARITIHGIEATSERQVTLEATMPVHFANWAD
jgi:hypothetical protein